MLIAIIVLAAAFVVLGVWLAPWVAKVEKRVTAIEQAIKGK